MCPSCVCTNPALCLFYCLQRLVYLLSCVHHVLAQILNPAYLPSPAINFASTVSSGIKPCIMPPFNSDPFIIGVANHASSCMLKHQSTPQWETTKNAKFILWHSPLKSSRQFHWIPSTTHHGFICHPARKNIGSLTKSFNKN